MLRIHESPADGLATLRLEGRIAGPWVDELRRVTDGWRERGYRVSLDLAGVSYADRPGVSLLRDLQVRDVGLEAASPFVAALLDGDE